jgi:hypothetical protein
MITVPRSKSRSMQTVEILREDRDYLGRRCRRSGSRRRSWNRRRYGSMCDVVQIGRML